MENGARPAAGARWLAAAPPGFRARVVQKIMKNFSQVPQGQQVGELRLHEIASGYEAKVFNQSDNAEDYLRTISHKTMGLRHIRQPAASELQQQAQMGRHQMRPVDAVLVNSSRATMPQMASATPLPVRPPQLHNMHIRVNQAQPAKLLPVAPVVQTVVTQIQDPCPASHDPAQQPQPRMNQQDLRVDQRQSYQTHNGQHAIMQAMQSGGQNNLQQLENPHLAGEVDWREDMFNKIKSLKDAHLSELFDFVRLLGRFLPNKANGQLESSSLTKEQAAQQCRYAEHMLGKIKQVLSFLQLQKTNIPEGAKGQVDKLQTAIHDLLRNHREIKARLSAKNGGRQSQNCREPPRDVNMISGAAENSQQNHHEQHAAEASSHSSSQNTPSETPFTQEQNHSDHLAGETEDNSVRGESESPVAANLPADTVPSTGRQEMQQRHPADEVIPQLTQTVEEHAGTSPAQQQTHSAHSVRVEAEDDSVRAEAERPIGMEALGVDTTRSSSPAALRSLASDMGVNLKRDFHRTTSDTMDGRSCCHKRRKTYDSVVDEITATSNMLVETEIRISEDDMGVAGGTVIELCYDAVSLTARLREAICASAIWTKLLVPADYPLSSPVVLGSDGKGRIGVAGVVNMAFRRTIVLLHEPRSIEGMAKAWDSVVRRAVLQFAHRLGGGTFSSRYGNWESCIPA